MGRAAPSESIPDVLERSDGQVGRKIELDLRQGVQRHESVIETCQENNGTFIKQNVIE